MKDINIAQVVTDFIALILALCLHEAAHAFAAKRQGDTTAEQMGRLTLNPIAHMDLFGTVLMPLAAMLSGFPFLFGWAKPVPVDPRNFKSRRWGHALVAAAGPASNLVLAFVCFVILVLYGVFLSTAVGPGSFFYPLVTLITQTMWISTVLAFFNLIPIFPLDGGAVLGAFFTMSFRRKYEEFMSRFGFVILLLFLVSGVFRIIIYPTRAYIGCLQYLASLILGQSL